MISRAELIEAGVRAITSEAGPYWEPSEREMDDIRRDAAVVLDAVEPRLLADLYAKVEALPTFTDADLIGHLVWLADVLELLKGNGQ